MELMRINGLFARLISKALTKFISEKLLNGEESDFGINFLDLTTDDDFVELNLNATIDKESFEKIISGLM